MATTVSEQRMHVEVDRIPAVQLSLADVVFDHHACQQRWVRIVGLVQDGDDVLVTCEGDEQPLRIPAGALVAARRNPSPSGGDEADIQQGISEWYPGDVSSANAAVREHARTPTPDPAGTKPYPNAHYEGLYGGDLDHVVDAICGTADTETRGRRDEAFRRRRSQARREGEARQPAGDEEEGELLGRMGDGYAGDVGHAFRPQDS